MNTKLPPFIKGLKLSEQFFTEAVQPLLSTFFPQLVYSAARLDFGSDVLGFDTPMSRDHHWGPRLVLYLWGEDLEKLRIPLMEMFSLHLPREIHGYPTHFINLHSDGGVMQGIADGPVTPYISLTTVEQFFLGYAGVDVTREMTAADWLSIPWQRLATIASGGIFEDGLGLLGSWQRRLRWYPHDLWLYLLAAQWRQIDQEEPFMGRCGDVGDELGSQAVASRQVQRLMTLCFLMEKRYPPYSKWFGTAFKELRSCHDLLPILDRVGTAQNWREREQHLSDAYLFAGNLHNNLRLTDAVVPMVSRFHQRPYQVPHSDRYVQALRAAIRSEEVRALPPFLGSVDQFVHSIDVLESISACQQLKVLYQEHGLDLPNPAPLR